MPNNVQTTAQLHSIHMLQGNAQNPSSMRIQHYMIQELPDV